MPLVEVNGTRLFYDVTGPADAPPVVFSNSLGTTMEMWDLQLRALAGSFRCVRYETRGHGRSPSAGPVATLEQLADDLAGLMTAIGIDKAHIVGVSLGGMTAQLMGIRHPDRVLSLVPMATAPHLPPPSGWDERAALVEAQGLGAIVDGVMGRWFTPAMAQRDPGRLAAFRQRFLANSPEGYAACCRAIRDMDLLPRLGTIAAPTLVVAGEADPVTSPAVGEALAGAIPGARFAVVKDSAHILVAEQPEACNALLLEHLTALTPGVATVPLQAGLANRKACLGVEHVQRSIANAGPFAAPFQAYIGRMAWGDVWGDPALPWKMRSVIVLSTTVALHREEEFKLHLRPALANGLTLEELRALLIQCAVYSGVPAANAAFRWVKDVLGSEADAVAPLETGL